MEKFYNVKINSPSFIILFGGKPFRTPVLFEKVNEKELSFLQAAIRASDIPKYKIEEWQPPESVEEEVKVVELYFNEESLDENKEVVVEELDSMPKSLLDKLICEDEGE